jgi:hypothetical protein
MEGEIFEHWLHLIFSPVDSICRFKIAGVVFLVLVNNEASDLWNQVFSQPLFSEVAQSLRTYLVGEKLCRYIIFDEKLVEIIYLSINLLLVQKSCGRESLCSK